MTQEEFFRNIYVNLNNNGKITHPRGTTCLEIENFHIDIPAYYRFINFESRKLKTEYIRKEFLWYCKGNKHDLSILNHASMWKSLVTKEGTIYSNYGQYIFTEGQLKRCIDLLIEDKDSRRATITILQPYHLLDEDAPEIPCTNSLSFRIRDNKLNCTVKMRSTDAIWGSGNDWPIFSFIHEIVFKLLESFYELEIGNMHFSTDSFHIYDRHFEMLDKIINGDKFKEIDCPRIFSTLEAAYLFNCRDWKEEPEEVTSDWEFTRWLNS
jgi:thymidylate synthase